MKKTLLFLLLLTAFHTYAQPTDLSACDTDGDGIEIFDLAAYWEEFPAFMIPTNYQTQADAENEVNPIANPSAYVSGNSTVWVRVTDTNDDTFIILSYALRVIPPLVLQAGTFCESWTGTVTQAYLLDSGIDPSENFPTFQWYHNNVAIAGATGSTFSAMSEGMYTVEVIHFGGCEQSASAFVSRSGPASPIGTGYTIDGQNITMTVNGYGEYRFALDDGPIMDNGGVFMDAAMGLHTVYVHDSNGCGTLAITDILVEVPNAPDGEPSQSFVEGQTLADVVVEGQNIQWYANDNNENGRMMEAALPLSTLLVDGTTYYATQTINGVESTHRLPVTVSLSLGVHHNPFANFSYHPNPVKNNFEISNSETMDRIGIYNVLGQSVVEKIPNTMVSVLDLSGLKTGIYLMKIQSGEQEKTIRIIKE